LARCCPGCRSRMAERINRAVQSAVAKAYADAKDALADIETPMASMGSHRPDCSLGRRSCLRICAPCAGDLPTQSTRRRVVLRCAVQSAVAATGMRHLKDIWAACAASG
jgi:hypothetical protein